MTTADFPILDATRPGPDQHGGRTIIDTLDPIEPFLDETDYWCSMPLRLVHSQLAGVGIELGPYSLDHNDIERLRAAIAVYDDATGRNQPLKENDK